MTNVTRSKAPPKRLTFTANSLLRLKKPRDTQTQYWDDGRRGTVGLSCMVSAKGMLTLRSNFMVKGKPQSRRLWEVGTKVTTAEFKRSYVRSRSEISWDMLSKRDILHGCVAIEIERARDIVREDRRKAEEGEDPRARRRRKIKKAVKTAQSDPNNTDLNDELYDPSYEYDDVTDKEIARTYRGALWLYINNVAEKRQWSWQETKRVLTRNCESWLDLEIRSITEDDTETLIQEIKDRGQNRNAQITLSLLTTFWEWCWKKRYVTENVMKRVVIEFDPPKERDRVYSDNEIKKIFKAADKLNKKPFRKLGKQAPHRGSYIKLLLLLGIRVGELRKLRWDDFDNPEDPTVLTIPPERTKSRKTQKRKRPYIVPLPPFALEIIRSIPRTDRSPDLVFPGEKVGIPMRVGKTISTPLKSLGAPSDFECISCRHTIATHLVRDIFNDGKGYNADDVKLALNHATGSGATPGYIHDVQRGLKLKVLQEWADHVKKITN